MLAWTTISRGHESTLSIVGYIPNNEYGSDDPTTYLICNTYLLYLQNDDHNILHYFPIHQAHHQPTSSFASPNTTPMIHLCIFRTIVRIYF